MTAKELKAKDEVSIIINGIRYDGEGFFENAILVEEFKKAME